MAKETECTIVFYCLANLERGAGFYFGHVSKEEAAQQLHGKPQVVHLEVFHTDLHPRGSPSRIWLTSLKTILKSDTVRIRVEHLASDFLNQVFRKIPIWFYADVLKTTEKMTGS